MTDRGVSDLLGYTLLFGLIIVATVSVSAIAVGQLETVRDAEQLSNAERGFGLLDQNIDDIQTNRAAVRGGEVALGNGRIALTSDSDSAVRVGVTSPTDDYDERIPVRSLVYRLDSSTVAYESGAVIRADDGNGLIKQEPKLKCTSDTALISVVTLRGDTSRALSGGTVSVRASERVSRVLFPINGTGPNSTEGSATVTVDVADTQFTDAWVQYFEQSAWQSGSSSTEFRCPNVDSYYVRQSVVNISLTQ